MKDIHIKYKWLLTASLTYIYLPVILFFGGWLRTGCALIVCLALLFCFYRMVSRDDAAQEYFSVNLFVMVFAFLLLCFVGYCAGYGRFVDQTSDWNKHNAVLADLVNHSWPVLYTNGNEHSMLTYYIGQYMVPAAAGKAMHSVRAAELVMYGWNVLGLMLVYMNILFFSKAGRFLKQFFYVLMIPLFSIPLRLSEFTLAKVTDFDINGTGTWFMFIFDSGIMLQYSANFVLLSWVFAQTIPIWLIVIVFLIHRDRIEYYVFMLLPAILFGTLTFIGIFPLAIASAIEILCRNKKAKDWLLQIFSIENVLTALCQGVVLLLYLYGNVTGDKPSELGFGLMPYTQETWILYLVFVGVNIIPFAVLLFKEHKKNAVFYTIVLSLLALPLFRMGRYNDLTMRASIPALFVLMIYAVQNIYYRIENYNGKITTICGLIVMVLLLLTGMFYPVRDIEGVIRNDDIGKLGREGWSTLESFANRSLEDVDADLKYNYYSYDIENNVFCRYLMKGQSAGGVNQGTVP